MKEDEILAALAEDLPDLVTACQSLGEEWIFMARLAVRAPQNLTRLGGKG
jgi:hypothetical protein